MVQKLDDAAESNKTEKTERVKKKTILVADIEKFPEDFKEKAAEVLNQLPAFMVQVDEDRDHTTIISDLEVIQNIYNANKKASKPSLNSISNVFESAQPKLFKERNLTRKTKEPLLFVF